MSQWSAQPFFLLHCVFFSVKWKEAAASLQSKPKSQYQALFSSEMLWRLIDLRVSLRPGWENSHLLKEQEKSGVFVLSSIICGARSVCACICLKTEWGEGPRVWWVHKMVKERFLVPHLLLDLLVSVIQGNLFSALPHDGFCVAVAAKQGESWLLKQAHKGFCNE